MRSLNLTLAVGLVASASAVPGPANRVSRRDALVQDLSDSVAHIVKTSDDKYLSDEALRGQMDIINHSFSPHNISFVLVETEHISDSYSNMSERMLLIWDHNRGDARTLDLYFVEGFGKFTNQTASAYAPQRLSEDKTGAYKVDGVIVATRTVPNGPGWIPGKHQGNEAVQAIAHWLGLMSPLVGGRKGQNDLVDDTPTATEEKLDGASLEALDSCPEQTGLDPMHNLVRPTSNSCKAGFTRDQGRRMHQQWRMYREPHRVPTTPLLGPIEPLYEPGKQPLYKDPTSLTAMFALCAPHEGFKARETREDRCSTFWYCYWNNLRNYGTGEGGTWWDCRKKRAGAEEIYQGDGPKMERSSGDKDQDTTAWNTKDAENGAGWGIDDQEYSPAPDVEDEEDEDGTTGDMNNEEIDTALEGDEGSAEERAPTVKITPRRTERPEPSS